jgi:hypothetical protein
MTTPMSARDRKAISWGLVILVPALFLVWVVKPYFARLDEARQQLAAERETLMRERAAIESARRNPKAHIVADSAMHAMAPRLFEGRDDVMASAELASFVGDVARDSHVWLQEAATRPAIAAGGGVRALRIDVRAESDLAGVLALIRTLELGEKLIRIDRLDISRLSATEQDSTETLALSATITGYAIGPEAPAAAPPARKAQ